MFSSRGTVRYEERGQGYRDVEKVGKHCSRHYQEDESVTVHWSPFPGCLVYNTPTVQFIPNRTEQKIRFSMSPLQNTTVLQPSVLATGMIGFWL